jgi:nucleoside 2-deoxyribosyltransferase
MGEVLTEHVGRDSLTQSGDDGPDDRFMHDRDMAWLRACDLLVAEVSTPSLGVGYELGQAVALKKPVLCLYNTDAPHPLSAMVAGSPGIRTEKYSSVDEAVKILSSMVQSSDFPFRLLTP